MHLGNEALLGDIRQIWDHALILNRPGRALADVGRDVASGLADIEAYGQFVLSNPDFLDRLKSGAEMNQGDRASFFGGGAEGYVDYPVLASRSAA